MVCPQHGTAVLKVTTLPRSDFVSVSIYPIAPAATAEQAAVTTGAWARSVDLTPIGL